MSSAPLIDLLQLHDSGVWGDEDLANGISVLRSTNFRSDGSLNFENLALRSIEAPKRASKLLAPGDLLLEKSGGGPKQPVGRVSLFAGADRPHTFGNFIARLRPKSGVSSEYLWYYLRHFHSLGKTDHLQKQTTGIRNLELKRYLAIEVPLASHDVQLRHVDLLTRAEGIVRLRREAQRKAAELIPAIFIDMFGDPAVNSKNWPSRTLGEMATCISGGTPSKARQEFWVGDLPWVSPKDMKRDVIVSAIDTVSRRILQETSLKLLPIDTVLIVVRGMILVHSVPVAITAVPVVTTVRLNELC